MKLDFFRNVCTDTKFREWLKEEKEAALKAMTMAEGAIMHRGQGRYRLLDELEQALNDARDLRQ